MLCQTVILLLKKADQSSLLVLKCLKFFLDGLVLGGLLSVKFGKFLALTLFLSKLRFVNVDFSHSRVVMVVVSAGSDWASLGDNSLEILTQWLLVGLLEWRFLKPIKFGFKFVRQSNLLG